MASPTPTGGPDGAASPEPNGVLKGNAGLIPATHEFLGPDQNAMALASLLDYKATDNNDYLNKRYPAVSRMSRGFLQETCFSEIDAWMAKAKPSSIEALNNIFTELYEYQPTEEELENARLALPTPRETLTVNPAAQAAPAPAARGWGQGKGLSAELQSLSVVGKSANDPKPKEVLDANEKKNDDPLTRPSLYLMDFRPWTAPGEWEKWKDTIQNKPAAHNRAHAASSVPFAAGKASKEVMKESMVSNYDRDMGGVKETRADVSLATNGGKKPDYATILMAKYRIPEFVQAGKLLHIKAWLRAADRQGRDLFCATLGRISNFIRGSTYKSDFAYKSYVRPPKPFKWDMNNSMNMSNAEALLRQQTKASGDVQNISGEANSDTRSSGSRVSRDSKGTIAAAMKARGHGKVRRLAPTTHKNDFIELTAQEMSGLTFPMELMSRAHGSSHETPFGTWQGVASAGSGSKDLVSQYKADYLSFSRDAQKRYTSMPSRKLHGMASAATGRVAGVVNRPSTASN